jgi:hypothetical protein
MLTNYKPRGHIHVVVLVRIDDLVGLLEFEGLERLEKSGVEEL